MTYLTQLINNSVLITAILSWFTAQVLKVIFVFICDREINFKRLVGSGGMPSSHSAFVVSLAVSVGIVEGFESVAFAITVCMALVVMYDAAGVRRAAGQQASILNKLVDEWDSDDHTLREKRLKELLGHTPLEVIAGALLGVMIAVMCHL
jgi:hypothetical protein